jgi:hypothetical protein
VEDRGLEPLKEIDATSDSQTGCDDHNHASAANALHGGDTNPLALALIDADLRWLLQVWPTLPESVRRPIIALTQALQPPAEQPPTVTELSRELEALSWTLARDCRSIVQSCLREEEWRDADAEFFDAIFNGLKKEVDRSQKLDQERSSPKPGIEYER